jgi:hypothetical protein
VKGGRGSSEWVVKKSKYRSNSWIQRPRNPAKQRTTLGDMVLRQMRPLTVTYLQSIHRALRGHELIWHEREPMGELCSAKRLSTQSPSIGRSQLGRWLCLEGESPLIKHAANYKAPRARRPTLWGKRAGQALASCRKNPSETASKF